MKWERLPHIKFRELSCFFLQKLELLDSTPERRDTPLSQSSIFSLIRFLQCGKTVHALATDLEQLQ